ncbi:sortase [Lacisediminihabitans changchengi]|uniref:sortase n=1 Tax=Lacisediminihabitans changchengi TaxID=2787634 RepID=UPI0027DD4FED|nr:sortase [Lacisediminihabitans changchengi]
MSEGDFDDHLLEDGTPLGFISIPSLGVNQVFVEGTSSSTLTAGPGHRRDTVLPGQIGTSVILGRASAFGGPFARIQELAPGDTFTARTGQGVTDFSVIGVRYAGDPVPTAPNGKQSRLILETARGAPFAPSGVAYVDAQATSAALPVGQRQTTIVSLPPEDAPLASDTTTVWALVFALQFLIVVEIGAVWAYRRIGAQKTWIVFVPLTVLAGIYVTNQVTILLPNLL